MRTWRPRNGRAVVVLPVQRRHTAATSTEVKSMGTNYPSDDKSGDERRAEWGTLDSSERERSNYVGGVQIRIEE